MSDRLISYFASSIYGSDFDIIAVREALQNSVDAKAKTFRVHMKDDRNVIIENDGRPMTLEQIQKQLFVLGESTKTNGKDTGFFGVGECAIISPCEKWKIETGNLIIEDFKLRDTSEYFHGTKHTLTFREDIRRYKIESLLSYHNVKTKVVVQDQYGTRQIKRQNFARCRKMEIPNGAFIWKKSGDTYTVIRVNGVPQTYDNRYDNNGTWIIDLDTSEVLTVNREQIRDETTKASVEKIEEYIRKISEHVTEDKDKPWYTINAPFLFLRESGHTLRRDVYTAPTQKMYECLEMVNQWYEKVLHMQDKEYKHAHKIGLCYTKESVRALLRNDIILVNVNKRRLNPPTRFILTLIDDYCHELAHILEYDKDHEKQATWLRKMAWSNPKIIEALRKTLRYG